MITGNLPEETEIQALNSYGHPEIMNPTPLPGERDLVPLSGHVVRLIII